MENSLVRPTLTRSPSLGGRKDVSRIQNPSGHQLQTFKNSTRKFGNYKFTRRNNLLEDATIKEDIRNLSNYPKYVNLGCSADAYSYASSHLRLSPASMESFGRSGEKIPCWDLITEVSFISEAPIQCPICLNSPIFPRMERCAHVYCGPCAVQFIKYENEGASKKCAVCSWTMRMQDLKRVTVTNIEPLKVGSNLEMSLVRRSKVESHLSFLDVKSMSSCDSSVFRFIVEVSWSELHASHTAELSGLLELQSECVSSGETDLLPHISYLIHTLTCELEQIDVNSGPTPTATLNTPISSISDTADYHLFYQASDGRLIFLDGLMWNCLISECGSVETLPITIDVTVTAIKFQKMSPYASKRWRHLSHIPLGHWFSFIEIDLKSLVSDRVLDKFASPLRARSMERHRKRLEDIQLTQQKEAAENQLPSLSPGFILSGHADLIESTSIQQSDFIPLCASREEMSTTNKFSSSFAEVTKSGAQSLVDRNRIANFSRDSAKQKTFNPATEVWPSLTSARSTSTNVPNIPMSNINSPPFPNVNSKRRRKKQASNS